MSTPPPDELGPRCTFCGRLHMTSKSCMEVLRFELAALLSVSSDSTATLRAAVDAAKATVEAALTPAEVARRLDWRKP